jgi:hypothetical protein
MLGLEVVDPEHPEQSSDSAMIRQLAQIQRRIFRSQNPWRMQEFLNLAPEQQDQLLEQYNELCGKPNHLHEAKTFTITLNVDQALNAAYAATYKPHLPVALGNRSKIILKLQAATKTQHLITLHATDMAYNLANIERASKPLKKLKVNALKGLQITDKTNPPSNTTFE